MKIRIPIPGAEVAGAPYAVEFDPGKIDAIGLSRGLVDQADADKGLELRSKLTLEFAKPEDAPKWVKLEGETDGT